MTIIKMFCTWMFWLFLFPVLFYVLLCFVGCMLNAPDIPTLGRIGIIVGTIVGVLVSGNIMLIDMTWLLERKNR